MNNRLHHVHICAQDIETSIRFYRDVFGAELIDDRMASRGRIAFLRIGDGRLNIYGFPPERSGPGSIDHFAIQTDQLDEVVRRLEAIGRPAAEPPRRIGPFRIVFARGPDDITVEVMEVDYALLPEKMRSYY